MSSIFLSPIEVGELTSYTRHGKQCEALRAMGIPFMVNPAGRPIVARAIFEARQAEETKPTARRKWQSNKTK